MGYDDLAHIKVGGISTSSDGASMEVFLESSRKNDQYRHGSHILLSATNTYACPVQLTAMLIIIITWVATRSLGP